MGKLKRVVWPPHGEYLIDTLTSEVLGAELKVLATQNPARYKLVAASEGADPTTEVRLTKVIEMPDGAQVEVL